jgi:uncharacterized coiled-coil protein SlyX
MAAALLDTDFQLASEMGPSPSREAELEERCRRMAAENELLREMVDTPDATPSANRPEAPLKPEEKQKLLEVISNLGHRIEDLEKLTAKQAREIEELRSTPKDQSEQMGLLRDGIVRLQTQLEGIESRIGLDIALDRQRITKLESPEHIQPKQMDRANMLRLLLAANNGKMLAKDARHRLGLSESQFSQLLKTLKGLVEVRPFHQDGRQNVITLTKALTNNGT